MFIFQLMGGLGNQMFQYAAARSLSLHTDITVKFHFDDPYKFVKRTYNLKVFNGQVEMASKKELSNTKPKRRWEKKWWQLQGKNPNASLVTEKKDYEFDSDFFNIPDGSYLYGFWQSELYFKNCETAIRKDFAFINEPSNVNIYWLQKIQACNAVSVHIRRGDYISVAVANTIHGICGMDYYNKAINYIKERIEAPVLFFFSDDIEWVKQHMKVPLPCFYVDANDESTNYEDLRLMSACKHHIIANSSFSWWGAWLNANSEKIVLAPEKWLNNNISTPDLIPSNWQCL